MTKHEVEFFLYIAASCVWFIAGWYAQKWRAIVVRQRQRRQEETQRELDDAQQAADALRGFTIVDGIELPLPSAAWQLKQVTFTAHDGSKSSRHCLVLGTVTVGNDAVNVGHGVPGLPKTAATKAYARSVQRAYSKRCAREAIEASK